MPIIGNLGKILWTGAFPHREDLVQPCWTPRLSGGHQRCSRILHSISGDLQTSPWNAKWGSCRCVGWNCRSQMAIGGVQRGSDMLSTILAQRYPLVNVYIANWKDPPFLMGKSTISMAIFNSYVELPEGNILTCFDSCLHSFHSFHMGASENADRYPPKLATLMGNQCWGRWGPGELGIREKLLGPEHSEVLELREFITSLDPSWSNLTPDENTEKIGRGGEGPAGGDSWRNSDPATHGMWDCWDILRQNREKWENKRHIRLSCFLLGQNTRTWYTWYHGTNQSCSVRSEHCLDLLFGLKLPWAFLEEGFRFWSASRFHWGFLVAVDKCGLKVDPRPLILRFLREHARKKEISCLQSVILRYIALAELKSLNLRRSLCQNNCVFGSLL